MIHSMTAFARAQTQGPWGSAVCELKSVNHRYLEIRIHLPEALSELEQPMHDYLRRQVKRGKLECYFRFQAGNNQDLPLQVDLVLAKRLIEANLEIAKFLPGTSSVNTMDVLQYPGVIQSRDADFVGVHQGLMHLLETAVEDFLATREREGEGLKNIFLQRLDALQEELTKAKERIPMILQSQRERILKHLSEAQLEMDKQRLEQEMIMFSQKIDVTEEIERIETHVVEVRRVLKQGGLIGRRLDFLMQELNREANTLGAKSVDVDTTRASLEMKVLIEQLREQMQNVE